MPKTAKTATTEAKVEKTMDTLAELKTKLVEIKLSIKAGQEKNTNAHKKMKKEIKKSGTLERMPLTDGLNYAALASSSQTAGSRPMYFFLKETSPVPARNTPASSR